MKPFSATVITIFPEMFPGPLGLSLAGKALSAGRWALDVVNPRDHAVDRHRSVDDSPFGGGAGMVMRPDVVARATDAARAGGYPRPLVYLSPRGRRFDQRLAEEWAAGPGVVLLCGRFEGVDERVIEAKGYDEVSLGDFVLSGGEVAALAVLDACVRLLPGVLGQPVSLDEESFAKGAELLEYPHYTRPADWEGREVPPVLLSGDHAKIQAWRREQALALTKRRRPDLIEPN